MVRRILGESRDDGGNDADVGLVLRENRHGIRLGVEFEAREERRSHFELYVVSAFRRT
jgi:hypothetical protein